MCHSVWFHNVIYLSFDVCTLCVFNAFGSYLTHPVFMGICCRLFVLMDKSFQENILTVAHFISKRSVCVCVCVSVRFFRRLNGINTHSSYQSVWFFVCVWVSVFLRTLIDGTTLLVYEVDIIFWRHSFHYRHIVRP